MSLTNLFISGAREGGVKIWDPRLDHNIGAFTEHTSWISALHIHAYDNNYILSGSGDFSVKLWDRRTYRTLYSLDTHDGQIYGIANNKKCVYTGSSDGYIRKWNINNGAFEQGLATHRDWVRCLYLHDKILVSGSDDDIINVYDKDGFTSIDASHRGVWSLKTNGVTLITGGAGGLVKAWDFSR